MERVMEGDTRRLVVVPEQRTEADAIAPAAVEECQVPFTIDSLHDLASPINQVGTMSGLFVDRYRSRLDEDADALLGHMERSTRHLHRLMDGLARYVQAVGLPGPHRSCNGDVLLAAALESIQGLIDSHGALITHDALPELYCHPAQIVTVFTSLIENSIQFRREDPPEVHVSAAAKENIWFLSVRDNGLGIASRYRKRVFNMFTRAHQVENPGAGVGLAIVRRIVENHQGHVWIESGVGSGTTVSFTLPQGEWGRVCAIA
jgi:light-regulated signal transduction histidine kinase (bacteriophytochrome)